VTNIAEFIQTDTGRIDVTIGTHTVCTIRPKGRKVHYRFKLPGLETPLRVTDSVPHARRVILHMLAGWFQEVGPTSAATGLLLEDQAERERSVSA
jgi:hypothetical protein